MKKPFRLPARNPLERIRLPARRTGAIYTLVFGYFTLPYMLIAFQKFNFKTGLFNSAWVGFDNFKFFFSSPRAWEVTFNTLKLNFLFIIVGTLAPWRWPYCSTSSAPLVLEGDPIHDFVPAFLVLGYCELHHLQLAVD